MTAHAQPEVVEGRFKAPDPDLESLSYLLIRPQDATEDLPLVVFLHGSGERGDDLEMVKTHGPPRQAAEGQGLPFLVLAPQCPEGQWWHTPSVLALVRHIAAEEKADLKRIHLTGLSMGGFGTWNAVALAPDLFASAVPICGRGDPATAGKIKHLPIWAFHGEKDDVVPVSGTRDMETALRAAGATKLRVTYYPEVEHDSWTRSYADPALYAWMMMQSKP